jgi:hypothetical protein
LRGAPRDNNGKRIDTKGKLLGYAYGDSLPDILPNGAPFIAACLVDDAARRQLKHGDLVVVDAAAKASRMRRRLRIFDKFDDSGQVHFLPDRYGVAHKIRPPHEVVAKVELRG